LLQPLTVQLVSSCVFRIVKTIVWMWHYLMTLSKPVQVKRYEEMFHWFPWILLSEYEHD